MNRAEQRKMALAQRLALSEEIYAEMCENLLAGFKTLNFEEIDTLHIFLPIVAKKEPDTYPMIDWLLSVHPEVHIVVPRADFNTSLMSQHVYPGRENLVLNAYGIPEPANAACAAQPDMVMVPLLAFDRRGYRLGYGKGFYDRFLAGLNAQKIGLSLFPALDEIKDVHLNDIRLDRCITPGGIVDFEDK